MAPQEYNELAGWDCKDVEILQSIIVDSEPLLSCEPFKNDNEKEITCRAKLEESSTVKRHTNIVNQTTIKKPRSPYNLFFQVERQLVIAELSCSPQSISLDRNILSVDHSQGNCQGRLLALEDALHNVPLPARYRGANILNPLKVINNQRRKHCKSHGKIGFVQLSQTIAKKWKHADQETKDYFKALSVKDLQRYKYESEIINISCTSISTDDDSKTLHTNGIHTKPNKPISILTHTTRRKRVATQDIDHPEAHLKRRHPISQQYQVKPYIMHDIDAEPSAELMRGQSIPTSHWMYPPASDMYHVPVHVASNEPVCIMSKEPVNLGCSDFDPIPCFTNDSVHHACMKPPSGDEVNDELRQFLSQLVNE